MRMVVVALAGMLATAGPALARQEPLTVDVILGLESFGRVAIDPSGAVAVFEERRARGDLPRHDLEAEGANRYARLYRIDLDAPDHPRPLLTMDEDAGYSVGAFSPSGRRLAVFRLRNDEWRLGIVEIAAGEVVWTDVAPELGLWGPVRRRPAVQSHAPGEDRQAFNVVGQAGPALEHSPRQGRRLCAR
jgi:hypothetical protein